MNIKMTSLKRKNNGDWFARKGIPADVRDSYKLAYGKSQEERFTRASSITASMAKVEFSDWLAEIEERINRLRNAINNIEHILTHRQMHALVGRWYEWFTAREVEEEITSEAMDEIHERYQSVIETTIKTDDLKLEASFEDEERSIVHAAKVRAFVAAFSEIDPFMATEGVALSADARNTLIDTLEEDFIAALSLLRRRSDGDYRDDDRLRKFPQVEASSVVRQTHGMSGMTIWQAFEGWVAERKPAESTINRWRGVFEDLNKFHNDGDVVLFTDDNAVAWKDTLVSSKRGTRTINEIWLSAARTVFGWVKTQKKIKVNPFEGVKVAGSSKPTKTRELEFNEDEMDKILKGSLVSMSPRIGQKLRAAYRWVPWLCAYTGARGGEMTQLRKQDFKRHKEGFWVITLTPEAGTVKGFVYREVPVHEHLIAQGLLDFVSNSEDGPLFHNGTKAKTIDPLKPPRPPHVVVRNKVATWVRDQGVTDKRISPNHAWRHTFKRRAARVDIEKRLRDGICGHSDGSVGAHYETPTIEDLASAIAKFPRYNFD